MKQVHYKTLLTNIGLALDSLSKQGFSCRTNFTSNLMDAHELINSELDTSENVVFYTSDAMEQLKASTSVTPSINLGVKTTNANEVRRVFRHFDLNVHGFKQGDTAMLVDMSKYHSDEPLRSKVAIC